MTSNSKIQKMEYKWSIVNIKNKKTPLCKGVIVKW